MNFLSTDQKRQICMLARRAYEAMPNRETFELANDHLSATKCFEAWRHVEQGKVTGRQSLGDCTSEQHFLPLLAHFANLAGDGARALQLLLRHADERRIVVYFKLCLALEERGLDEGYAAHICRCKFKCDLGDATEKNLWSLFFDVRKRRKVVRPATPKPARYVRLKAGALSTEQNPNIPF